MRYIANIFSLVLKFSLLMGKMGKPNCKTGLEEGFYPDSSQVLLSRWLQHHWSTLTTSSDLQTVFRECILDQRDSLFGGTILNQVARSYNVFPIELIENILFYLEDEGYDIYVTWMDKDGDIPLHSAIKGIAPKEYIKVFASTITKYTKNTLISRNHQEEVPLDLAFELGHFQAVEVLLELSIYHGVLAHLTGVHALSGTTLLHKAFKRGHAEYFRVLLMVCAKLHIQILPVLLIPDNKGNTPWHFLMNRNKHHEIVMVLSLCQKYKVDINDLHLNIEKRTSMLHAAVRRNDAQCEKTLRKWGAKDQPDKRGVWPPQRNHRLNGASSDQDVHPVTSVKALFSMLEDIGNWEALCVNLGIRSGLIDELRHSRLEVSVMKLRCIEAYFNTGEATWEDVVLAVTLYPIMNTMVANRITQKHLRS